MAEGSRAPVRPMRRVAVLQRVPGVFCDPSFPSGFFLTFPSSQLSRAPFVDATNSAFAFPLVKRLKLRTAFR